MNLPKPNVILLAFLIELFLPMNVLLNAFWGYYPSGLPWLSEGGWKGIGVANMITCGALFVLLVSTIVR